VAGLRDVREAVALVTGASSGIGEALARELARRGARVALIARRRERLEDLAEELARAGHAALAHACDVRDPASVADAARAVEARWGGVDLLVNNAGYGRHVLFADHDPDDVRDIMLTNYMGAVHWIGRVLPGMRARRRGWIVNVSSFAGKIGQADEVAYSASKFALTGLSQGLAQELRPLGVHVLCVHPTLVRTGMFTPEVLARMPASTRRSFIEADTFARHALAALAKGRTEAVIPRRMRGPILLHALFPEWMGRAVGRVKLDALRRAGMFTEDS
jgi:short-subunit dehydrogenase